jgi:hypothetical protein
MYLRFNNIHIMKYLFHIFVPTRNMYPIFNFACINEYFIGELISHYLEHGAIISVAYTQIKRVHTFGVIKTVHCRQKL